MTDVTTAGPEDGLEDSKEARPSAFRRTLISVMTAQIVALIILWILQTRYSG